MNTLFIIVALAIVVIAIVWRVATRPGKSVKPRGAQLYASTAEQTTRSTTRWRAVKIAPGLMSCDAAAKLAGQVFLASESPVLPLDGCSEGDCRCKYVHLEDRRSGGDRRIELGDLGAYLPVSHSERRQVGGRRSTDLVV